MNKLGGVGGSSGGEISVGDIKIKFPPEPKQNKSPITINTPSPYSPIVFADKKV